MRASLLEVAAAAEETKTDESSHICTFCCMLDHFHTAEQETAESATNQSLARKTKIMCSYSHFGGTLFTFVLTGAATR